MQLLENTLGEILEKWAYKSPNQEFMVYPDRDLRFTYKQFNQRVNELAKGLLFIGIQKGDKIGIWAKNIPDWTTLMFASAKIGAILVTINTHYKSNELAYLLKNADVKLLCFDTGFRDNNFMDVIAEVCPDYQAQSRDNLHFQELPELKHIVFLGHKKHKGMFNLSELILLGKHTDNIELESAREGIDCHDVTLIIYTSGTTGYPKGVMLSHHNIINNGYSVGQCLKYSPNDKLLVCVPLFHSFGCVLANCAIVTHGATMVFNEEFEPHQVLASIEKEKCTALYGVPTMFIQELAHPEFEAFDLTSLRTGIMAGAPCPIDTMNEVMDKMHIRDIISVYGLAESSPGMTATRTHNSAELRSKTVGFELPNIDVKIIHPETGKECDFNEQGEICCKGYNVMKGYYKYETVSKEAVDETGWLHSGDLAIKLENGFYQITGKLTQTINRGGESIDPREIENFLRKIHQIAMVKVIGVPSKKWGEEICALIKLKEKQSISEKNIIEYCSKNIAYFKIPKYVFFVEDFPKTAEGKIKLYKLKEMALDFCKK